MLRLKNIFSHISLTKVPYRRMSLNLKQAQLRSKCLDTSSYIQNTVYIDLLKGKTYEALVKINFKLVQVLPDLFIDFQGQNVKFLQLNQTKYTPEQIEKLRNDKKVFLPAENLNQQSNELLIHIQNDYSTTGNGLHSFVDIDQMQYVYSQCEPYHASLMFPCFDQPDLKGHFKLVAHAPKEWTIITNERPVQLQEDITLPTSFNLFKQPDYQTQEFLNTKPLSSYLYAILAGPYSEIKCPENLLYRKDVPMSFFVRASLLKFLEKYADEYFILTSDGMRFYENMFGYPYPFSKYDQIFCPEYSTGAMENAGAVTLNDVYVFKEDVPLASRSSLHNTILHELSHMWFGDLVTMKWWDDLWLNESFAEFISHLCLHRVQPKHMESVDIWVTFFQRKIWGYVEDQLETTHPIYCQVENTKQAENIFDGITYAKGAALLKQLFFMMGEQTFAKAMGRYFNRFAFKNTTLSDFFQVLQEAFNEDQIQIDLNQWRDQWIMQAGLNDIEAEVTQDNKLKVIQKPNQAAHPTLRNHVFQVALYGQEGNLLKVHQVRIPPQNQTLIEIEGFDLSQVKGFLLNYNDESFIKTNYSPEQTQFLLANISKLEPSLSRILALRSIWDQVRDGQTCFLNFAEGVKNYLIEETDDTISQMVLSWFIGGVGFYTPRKLRKQIQLQLSQMVEKMLEKTDPTNKNRQLVLKKYFATWTLSPEKLKQFIPMLENESEKQTDNKFGLIGLKNGWTIIKHIFAYVNDVPLEKKWELFDKWAKHDGTDEIKNYKKYLEILTQHSDQRKQLWDYFTKFQKQESVPMVSSSMAAFNHDIFEQDLAEFEVKYFQMLPEIFKNQESEYAKSFYNQLAPISDNIEVQQQEIQKLLNSQLENDILIKLLKESFDFNRRRLRTYATFQ